MKDKKPEYATPRKIMGEAVEHLKGYHKEAYLLIVRDGKTPNEAAVIMEIDELRVIRVLDEAVELVSKYCKRAMAKGRI